MATLESRLTTFFLLAFFAVFFYVLLTDWIPQIVRLVEIRVEKEITLEKKNALQNINP